MKKNLIVYYSWANHTKTLAEYIREFAGGDMLELTMKEPYCDDYDKVLARSQNELENNIDVEVINLPDNIDEYDNIFIGSPNWFNTYALPVLSFCKKYDFLNKTVIPFCAHGSKGCEKVNADIVAACKNANSLGGFGTFGKEMNENTKDDVLAWLKGKNLV